MIAAPEKVTIGTNHTQNTIDEPSWKNFYKEECGEIVGDEGYGNHEEGGEILDNWLVTSAAQVNIGVKHTLISMDTTFNKICNQEKVGEIFDDEVYDNKEKGWEIAEYEGHDDQDKGEKIIYNQ